MGGCEKSCLVCWKDMRGLWLRSEFAGGSHRSCYQGVQPNMVLERIKAVEGAEQVSGPV
jgi:hypothetical protein